MKPPASLEGSDELRLFLGLPLPQDDADGVERWARESLSGSTLRVLPAADLHVTLAFLGARPVNELPELRAALHEAAAGSQRPVLTVERYHESRSVAMLVLRDEGGSAGRLQARLVERLEALGLYRCEARPWLAHLTVARFRERPRLCPPLPPRSDVSPSEAALYHSLLRRGGAHYEIVEAVPLGG